MSSDTGSKSEILTKARDELAELMNQKRLGLGTISKGLGGLLSQLDFLKAHPPALPIGAILIDSLDSIPTGQASGAGNESLKAISMELRERALSMNVSLVAGCPLGHTLSRKQIEVTTAGSGAGLERDASLVLALWNETRLKEEETRRPNTNERIDFDLMVMKNRRGACPNDVLLRLHRPTGALSDLRDDETGSPQTQTKAASPIRRALLMPSVDKGDNGS